MIVGQLSRNPPPQLNIGEPDLTLDRVTQLKLLGITIHDLLEWNDHVVNVCSKANKRLYFLRQLPACQPITYCVILQYVLLQSTHVRSLAWHTSLTVEKSNRIESIQHSITR